MFGYTAEEIIGHSIQQLVPVEMHNEEDMILTKLKSGARIDHYETTRIKKNGERFEVSVTISPIRDDKAPYYRCFQNARDISERKKIERLRIQSETATGRMAGRLLMKSTIHLSQ
ncbi:MAG: sensor signal transduction histidine kinase [Edaphobacter sp.]|nr:sensor signal transduction histidine kinase [Edaphobacter sp.]